MNPSHAREHLRALVARLKETRYRGLLAYRGPREGLASLLETLPAGGAYFYSEGLGKPPHIPKVGGSWVLEDRRNSLKHLGREYANVVVELDSRTRAGPLAAVSETVVGGGMLVLAFLGCGELSPFLKYLWQRSCESESLLRADYCGGRETLLLRLPDARAGDGGDCGGLGGKGGRLEVRLAGLARSCGQRKAFLEILSHFRNGGPGVLVLGDRGRGKSGVQALFAAWLLLSRKAPYIPVVSSGLHAVQSFFNVLSHSLSKLGVGHRVRRQGGLIEALTTRGTTVEHVTPGRRLESEVVVVEEAGLLGVGRVAAAVRRARFFTASTTVHGYEGGGKALASRLLRQLPGVLSLWLEEPIRYPLGDPLEKWVYDAFLLNAEPPTVSGEPTIPSARSEVRRVACVSRDIPGQPWFRSAYGILVTAHYRNNPDDLQLLIEEASHNLCVLLEGDTPLSVAQVSVGDQLIPRLIEELYGLRVPRLARVVRIATHPRLWGRGLGSALLEHVEREVLRKGARLIGASFSNPDALGFWLRNGYRVVHVSARFNRFTGEKNIVVLKALDREWEGTVECMAEDMRWRLALGLPTVYWDLEPHVALALLSACPSCDSPPPVSAGRLGVFQVKRLRSRRLLEEGVETVADLALAALVAGVGDCSLGGLGDEASALIGVVQGRRSQYWLEGKEERGRVADLILSLMSRGGVARTRTP